MTFTAQIWVVNAISMEFLQSYSNSIRGETSGIVVKCRLFYRLSYL